MQTPPPLKSQYGMQFAWPYFLPAWLYVPYLFIVAPAGKDLDENSLTLLLCAPQLLGLLVLIPLRQGRITEKHIWRFLGLPFVIFTAVSVLFID